MKTLACLAASLDGKISTRDTLDNPNAHVRIGSEHDLQHLLQVRDECDAVLMGAGTFRSYARPRRGTHKDTVPLHCILTRTFDLRPGSTFFKNQPAVPTLVFSPTEAPADVRAQYPAHVQWVTVDAAKPAAAIKQYLADAGYQSVLVEGGGEIVDLFLREHALDELVLTICPLLVGGEGVSGLLTGAGFYLAEAPRVQIVSLKRVGDELYLRLALKYPAI